MRDERHLHRGAVLRVADTLSVSDVRVGRVTRIDRDWLVLRAPAMDVHVVLVSEALPHLLATLRVSATDEDRRVTIDHVLVELVSLDA
jgi:hypothetical protein